MSTIAAAAAPQRRCCRSCSASRPAAHRFCHECGAQLGGGARLAHRRPLPLTLALCAGLLAGGGAWVRAEVMTVDGASTVPAQACALREGGCAQADAEEWRLAAELHAAAAARAAAVALEDAFDASEFASSPKEIHITCPEAPAVTISDLDPGSVAADECLVLAINAPDLAARLVLKCDGSLG